MASGLARRGTPSRTGREPAQELFPLSYPRDVCFLFAMRPPTFLEIEFALVSFMFAAFLIWGVIRLAFSLLGN